MKSIGIFYCIAFIVGISAKPIHEDGIVEVHSDNQGQYKYSFSSTNITIVEERNADGNVNGLYSYIDEFGERQTVEYISGVGGFRAAGNIIPVIGPSQVAELPEVYEARLQHHQVSEQIRRLLPELKLGEDVVEEQPIVALTKAEQLSSIEEVLNPKYLAFAEDTPEIKELKEQLYQAYIAALAK